MITEFFDTASALAHDQFQAWRASHPDGVFLTLATRTRANLHGARCQHLGSGPPYFLSDDGLGSLTAKRKLCAPESELLAWAAENGVAVTRCQHCAQAGFVRSEGETTSVSGDQRNGNDLPSEGSASPSDSLAARLRLRASLGSRMLRILAASAQLVYELRPDWYRVRLDGQHLRLFCGRLIVMTLEGDYVWLATDPDFQPVDFSALASWRLDRVSVRPGDAKGVPYPSYRTPPSLNGFYMPAYDPVGAEWQYLRASHVSYLKRAAAVGRAPDHRTVHDSTLAAEIRALTDPESPESVFDLAVCHALASDPESRRRRLKEASSKPSTRTHEIRVFERNPDVVAEVLFRAAGRCESCRSAAPFRRSSDGSPYLEVHHEVRLADGGDDTVENAVALCPNCHRQRHFG